MSVRSVVGRSILVCAVLSMTATFASADKKDDDNGKALAKIESLLNQILKILTTPPTPPTPPAQTTTRLLFPYVTNVAGFDTGLAVSNTGKDSTGTIGSAGTCTFYFFGTNAPANPFTTASIPAGGQTIQQTSTLAPGFNGYVEVVCHFPLAHGFGFLSDVGARNLAATVPALVLPIQRTTSFNESVGQ